ncbi:hypothetical protein JMJ35_009617 [Cladonia borealis]|uniref:Uncharacterized protein n=1 Tax=Cladonia borealis TaxID=184061 RepID=A0AA39QU14_9LECA|nr:hypothetical protein JMJ35_009617 [Cladonia borealis]
MAATVKQYFLAPNFENPPTGLLQLGRIFDSPRALTPLNPQPYDLISIPDDYITTTSKENFRAAIMSKQGGRFGIFANFLQQFLPLGADLSTHFTRSRKSIVEAEKVETSFFEPMEEYLKAAVNVPSVVAVLEKQNYKKPLFMITGLKVVHGASKAVSTKKLKLGGDLTAQGDLTSLGAPGVAPGLKLGLDQARFEHIEWESAEPYVFAFRLREIYYRRGTDLESKAYTRGALYSEGNEQMAKAAVPMAEGKAETQIRMTAEEDVTLHDLLPEDQAGLEMIAAADEDDEECVCISMLGD